ncbi:MAG TPA: peroxidase-related enzyme [Candidatus Polarisedimenticolia bacterium]|nr:peroxidase-related enzyme [Candidatus Polarisedimenticolia bacterium]
MSYLNDKPLDEFDFPPLGEMKRLYGFIPNFYRSQTMRKDIVEAEIGMTGAILVADGALTRQQKEYLFLVCSAANLSTYCVTAHCEIVRMLGLKGPEPEKIAIDHNSTDLSIADKALLNFALKLNGQPAKTTRRDIEGLRVYGFTDQQILEAVIVVSFAKFANVLSFGLGTVPDFEPIKLPQAAANTPSPAEPRPGGRPSVQS